MRMQCVCALWMEIKCTINLYYVIPCNIQTRKKRAKSSLRIIQISDRFPFVIIQFFFLCAIVLVLPLLLLLLLSFQWHKFSRMVFFSSRFNSMAAFSFVFLRRFFICNDVYILFITICAATKHHKISSAFRTVGNKRASEREKNETK